MNSTSTSALLASACCLALLSACSTTDDPGVNQQSMRLEANSTGQFETCDAQGNCRNVPNPDACRILDIRVDTQTGETCERCELDDGTIAYDRCDQTRIECTVITAPEPDCVVCAYVGGDVLASTCRPNNDTRCEERVDAAGFACRVCYDANDRKVLDECRDQCDAVLCPQVLCAPGYVAKTRPGECCPTCVPVDNCGDAICAATDAVPTCPDGTVLARDPADCCGYTCEPVICPDYASSTDPNRLIALPPDCPPGYERDTSFPSCGECVPVDPTRLCAANSECGAGEYCALDECVLPPGCGCFEECDPETGECYSYCVDCLCMGVCRPTGHICPDYALPAVECQGGSWQSPGRDADGCLLPPVCVCDDGSVSTNGQCANLCDNVACFAPPPDCGPGYRLDQDYPYCCGRCVPDDGCDEVAACALVDCAPGFHCEASANSSATDPAGGPNACIAECVPDATSCFSSADCGDTEVCSTERGECLPPPGCNPGDVCPAVCAGECVPREAEECEPAECGPALGIPNWQCNDGSTGGPTGRCLRTADGVCAWEVRQCE